MKFNRDSVRGDGWYRNKRYPRSRRQREVDERDYTSLPVAHPRVGNRAYSCTIYPNGEFGVGLIPPKKKTKQDSDYDSQIVDGIKYSEVSRKYEMEDGSILYDKTDKYLEASNKLGIPYESSQNKKSEKKRTGLQGITGYGRRAIRNIAMQIERGPEIGIPQMGTLTIPLLSREANMVICQNWGEVVRRFFQACRRVYAKSNIYFRYISATEIQEKRFKKYGDCGLHLHFVYKAVYDISNKKWLLQDNYVRKIWKDILMQVLNKFGSSLELDKDKLRNTSVNYRREKIEKSASAYMAKYLSKGTEIINDIIQALGEEFIPRQWWSSDALSKKVLKKSLIRSQTNIASLLVDICNIQDEFLLRYSSPVYMQSGTGQELCIGYAGMLSNEGMKFIRSLL